MAQIEAPLQVDSSPEHAASKSGLSKSLNSSMFRGVASTRLSSPQTLKSNESSKSAEVIEKRLRVELKKKSRDVLAAFKTYDIDNSGNVTRGELRRVLELFCFSLTTDQFETLASKISANVSGTIRYNDFLKDFADLRSEPAEPAAAAVDSTAEPSQAESVAVPASNIQQVSGAANVDVVERLIRDKVSGNVRTILKAMQLFDYNRDGKIQRHELRKVIENYCGLKLTDAQFDKLWTRYDFHHAGAIDYVELLQKIGVANVPNRVTPSVSQTRASSALTLQSDPPTVRSLNLKRPFSKQSAKSASSGVGVGNLNGDLGRLASITETDDAVDQFVETERVFRARIKEQMGAVRKAFAAFDTQRDGFVEIDDLKAVLREFVLPLSEQNFAELMRRAGIKATGRVAWRTVLSKFEHPLAEKLNGQTLPIRNDSHHFNPIKGDNESVELERLLGLLHDQVRNGYGSFKQAFLQIDYNRDGKISRHELRKVLERFKIRVSDDQFAQLLSALGINGSQTISYHRFLEIFEPKDTEEHKWLTSMHRYNELQKPLNLAWRTVEELLCNRLGNNWKEVTKALAVLDSGNTQLIEASELRKVLERYAFPVSSEHFNALLARCAGSETPKAKTENSNSSAKYPYYVFFERLGVQVRPSDANGVSSMIIAKNEAAERDRMANLAEARRGLDEALNVRARFMSVDEVLVRLKDRIMLHNGQLHDAFHAVAQRAGALHRRDVRKFLNRIGIQLDDTTYEQLLSRLRFRANGAMTYADFVASFAEHAVEGDGLAAHIEQSGNHRYNSVRGDERGFDVDALEQRLRAKIRENFTDLRGAFHKFDETHSGLIDRVAFRKVLDSFMFVTNEEEFDKLAARFGLATRGDRIDYRKFLEHFETRDQPGAHRWLVSVHRSNPVRDPAALSAEDAHRCLVEKAYSQFHDLHAAFCAFDTHSRGFVTRRELSELLDRFQLKLAHGEFDRLWQLYDVTKSGKITYAEFVDALRFASHFAPADLGTSQLIMQRNHEDLKRHADTQQRIQEQLTVNQARVGESLSLAEVMIRLGDTLRDRHADVYSAFRKYDTNRKGYLTVNEFIRVLESLYLYLTEQQVADLLVLFAVPANENRLSYVQFLKAIEDRDSRFERGKRINEYVNEQRSSVTLPTSRQPVTERSSVRPSAPASVGATATTSVVSAGETEARLRRAATANLETLRKAFRAFDRNESGTVRVNELRRVLDTFCFALSDAQFRHVLFRARAYLIGAPVLDGDEDGGAQLVGVDLTDVRINYVDFLATFGKEEKKAQNEWLNELPRAGPNQGASLDEVESRIREFVAVRGNVLRRAFRDADYAQLGVVSRDEFLRVIRRFAIRVTDEQAGALFERRFVPENDFGNVFYEEFLNLYGCPSDTSNTLSTQAAATAEVAAMTNQTYQESARDFQSELAEMESEEGRPSTVVSTMASAERVERQLKVILGGVSSRKLNDLQAECRRIDAANTGEIERAVFLNALERTCSLKVSATDLQSVLDKYDAKSSGKFAYRTFLRTLLLSLDQPAENDQQRIALRRKLQKSKIPFVSGDKSEQFFDTMLRIRARVLEEWRSMRRAFRERDASGVGYISSVEFRNLLKQYQIMLTEEEFYHLAAYFDRSLDGRIGYNEFIRAFLETA